MATFATSSWPRWPRSIPGYRRSGGSWLRVRLRVRLGFPPSQRPFVWGNDKSRCPAFTESFLRIHSQLSLFSCSHHHRQLFSLSLGSMPNSTLNFPPRWIFFDEKNDEKHKKVIAETLFDDNAFRPFAASLSLISRSLSLHFTDVKPMRIKFLSPSPI